MNSVVEISLPQQRVVDGAVFPLALTSSTISLVDWVEHHRDELDELLRKHRGILFRGFTNLKNHEEFHKIVEATGLNAMDYIGGAAVRTQLTSRVFTANESPPSEKIPFHHEMAQTPNPPTHLFFFCEVPPAIGGETPILVSTEMYKSIHDKHPAIMDKVESLGVQYIRVMPKEDDSTSAIGRGWKSTFLCETSEQAEMALQKLGSSWEWLPDGSLKTITSTVPAVRIDQGEKRSGNKTFFNSIVAAYTGWNDSRNDGSKAVRTSDGEYLDPTFMIDAEEIMQDICVAIPWQSGDLLLLDNRTTMHSRRVFEGPRRILAALARDPR